MAWTRKRREFPSRTNKYSLVNELRKQGKIDEEFEMRILQIHLEDLIAIKLELAANASGAALYGVPIWRGLTSIIRDAILRYTVSVTRTQSEACALIGVAPATLVTYLLKLGFEDTRFEQMKKYNIFPRRDGEDELI